MRIGRKRAKFTVRVIENLTNKSMSFIVDNGLSLKDLTENIKNSLRSDEE